MLAEAFGDRKKIKMGNKGKPCQTTTTTTSVTITTTIHLWFSGKPRKLGLLFPRHHQLSVVPQASTGAKIPTTSVHSPQHLKAKRARDELEEIGAMPKEYSTTARRPSRAREQRFDEQTGAKSARAGAAAGGGGRTARLTPTPPATSKGAKTAVPPPTPRQCKTSNNGGSGARQKKRSKGLRMGRSN